MRCAMVVVGVLFAMRENEIWLESVLTKEFTHCTDSCGVAVNATVLKAWCDHMVLGNTHSVGRCPRFLMSPHRKVVVGFIGQMAEPHIPP